MTSLPVSTRTLTLLFTDIVGSVAMKMELGTARYAELLEWHHRLFAGALHASATGELLQNTGDGFLARFGNVSEAVAAALRFQHELSQHPIHGPGSLEVRIGIHSGEVTEIRAGDSLQVVGTPIDIASRILSLAEGRQILMSRTVFDDARQFVRSHPCDESMPLSWLAHGSYRFKGLEEATEVCEVGVPRFSPLKVPAGNEKARRVVNAEEEEMLGWRPAQGLEIPGRRSWIITRKLGEGGFGEVWLARHARTGQQRVHKFCFDVDRLRSFKRELTLFRLIREALGDRDDIAKLHDVRLHEAPYYLESEFVPDGNLAHWADERGGIGCVPPEQRLALLGQVCRAVAAAHSLGIIHKDIKPSNILIQNTPAGARPILCDFGIGAVADASLLAEHNITIAGFTETLVGGNDSSRTGTRLYAPPEAQVGQPATTAGDIFALGVMLYQLAIGDLSKPLASGWERDISDPLLREDIAACVDGDPSRRIASAAELGDRIEGLDARRAERVEMERERQLGIRRVRQLRAALAAVAVLVVLLSVFAGIYFAGQARRARQVTELDNRIGEAIRSRDWSNSSMARLNENLAALGALEPKVAAARGKETSAAMTADISERILQPNLPAVQRAGILEEIRQLAALDSVQATALTDRLSERLSLWIDEFALVPPFSGAGPALGADTIEIEPDGSSFRIVTPEINTRARVARHAKLEAEISVADEHPFRLILHPYGRDDSTYAFELARSSAPNPEVADPRSGVTGFQIEARILRSGLVLREVSFSADFAQFEKLRLSASVSDGHLEFRIMHLSPLVFDDAFPLASGIDRRMAVSCDGPVRFTMLRASRLARPETPNPMELGDHRFASENFAEAVDFYATQRIKAADPLVRAEAAYKHALSLLFGGRVEEALPIFEETIGRDGGVWSLRSGAQAWALRLDRHDYAEADAILTIIRSRFDSEAFCKSIPDPVRRRVLHLHQQRLRAARNALLGDSIAGRLDPCLQVFDFFKPTSLRVSEWHYLAWEISRAQERIGRREEALEILEEHDRAAASLPIGDWPRFETQLRRAQLLTRLGRLDKALTLIAPLHQKALTPYNRGQLLLEEASLFAQHERWSEVEERIGRAVAEFETTRMENKRIQANLIAGLLDQRRGRPEEARRRWVAEFRALRDSTADLDNLFARTVVFRGWTLHLFLGVYSGEITDDEIRQALDRAAVLFAAASDKSDRAMVAVAHQLLDALPPEAIRQSLLSDRGRDLAARVAFSPDSARDEIDELALLIGCRMWVLGSVGVESLTPEVDALVYATFRSIYERFRSNRFGMPAAMSLLASWKGIANHIGWASLRGHLTDAERPVIGYLLAHRFMRKGMSKEARSMFAKVREDDHAPDHLRAAAARSLEAMLAEPK